MASFWGATGYSNTQHFWGNSSSMPDSVPDLRKEFDDLIRGINGAEGIGQLMIIRLLNHDDPAPGYDEYRGGSTSDDWDQGELYSWSENYVIGHFTQTFGRAISAATTVNQLKPTGYYDKDKALIYLMSDSAPKTGDAVFRVATNEEGSAYYPVRRIEKWRIRNVEDRRKEHRKVAFYTCVCERVEL